MRNALLSRAMAGSFDKVRTLRMRIRTEPISKILPVLISLPRRQGGEVPQISRILRNCVKADRGSLNRSKYFSTFPI
jgi:hypothetical protein